MELCAVLEDGRLMLQQANLDAKGGRLAGGGLALGEGVQVRALQRGLPRCLFCVWVWVDTDGAVHAGGSDGGVWGETAGVFGAERRRE